MNATHPPLLTLRRCAVVAGLLALAACGGDSESTASSFTTTTTAATTPESTAVETTAVETTTPETATPETTTPPTTEPPAATDPQIATTAPSGLPAWASGEMVSVDADTGQIELPVELVPFCESSRSFYLAAKGLDYVTPDQVGATQQLFAALAALAPVAIEAAPSAEFAAEPSLANDQLAVLIPALEQVGYDVNKVGDLPDADSVFDAVSEFGETRNSLQEFLVQACGADQAVLDEAARGAAAAAAEAAGEPVAAAAGVAIANEDSTITVSVPPEWTDIEENTPGGYSRLTASSDVSGFYDLVVPGMFVQRGEGGFRDGGFVGRVLELQADLESAGCVLAEQTPYFDNTYTGQERIFSCGNDALDVRIFGGATDDESLYAMVLLVAPQGDLTIRQLIIDTFLVA